jgi:hypothetical protein
MEASGASGVSRTRPALAERLGYGQPAKGVWLILLSVFSGEAAELTGGDLDTYLIEKIAEFLGRNTHFRRELEGLPAGDFAVLVFFPDSFYDARFFHITEYGVSEGI